MLAADAMIGRTYHTVAPSIGVNSAMLVYLSNERGDMLIAEGGCVFEGEIETFEIIHLRRPSGNNSLCM